MLINSRVFGGRHAVRSDFPNSIVWQDQLEACQREELDTHGEYLAGGMDHELRHFAYVQPRFESFVTPRRRYVCILLSIAQVRGMESGDMRLNSSVRARRGSVEGNGPCRFLHGRPHMRLMATDT